MEIILTILLSVMGGTVLGYVAYPFFNLDDDDDFYEGSNDRHGN